MKNKALQLASVASMIDLFNADNILILQSLGYEVDVAANFKNGSITSQQRVNEYYEELVKQGIGVYQIPVPRSIFRIVDIYKSYKIVKKLSYENRYRIIHCHSPIGGVICRLACKAARRKYGTKVIYTAHGFHFFKGAPKLAWYLYYPLEKWCSRYTDVIITINKEDYELAKAKFHSKRIEYIPGIGVHVASIKNVSPDREKLRMELGLSTDDFVFMSTGQVSKRKNHEVVIKALAQIENEKVKYVIVGFGEEENRLRKLTKELKLEERVVFAGYRQDIVELLHSVDAFVFPSKQEGLPVALMEAMAARIPIIASRIRGNVDLIEDEVSGYLVDCDSVGEFFEAMLKVIQNDNSRMVDKAYSNILGFDRQIINEYMETIYYDVGK